MKKLFKILKREFRKKEKYAESLHKLKHEEGEQVNLFASRIRRYVKYLGLKKHKKDASCLDYLKLGVHNHIQNRLHRIQSFSKARRIAMEIESERIKTKPKQDTINTTNISANQNNPTQIIELLQKQLLD